MRLTHNPGRNAGLLYLLMSVPGFFSLMYVPGKLIVPGDTSATVSNILGSETLYRASIVAGLFASVVFVLLARALYRLFREVDEGWASLMAILVMISVAIGCALVVNDLAVLVVLRGNDLLAAFSQAQREAVAMLFLRLGSQGMLVNEVFWGLWLLPFGALIMRSGFIPRILGILLLVNGLAYVVASLTGLLLPAYSSVVNRAAMIPALGEVAIMLWLLIKGAKPPQLASECLQVRHI